MSERPDQTPKPGRRLLHYRGDTLHISLTLPPSSDGRAWLRTNIGHAATHRQELVARIEKTRPLAARDWHDIPMTQVSAGRYELVLPLLEVGCFRAKAFFLAKGDQEPVWPEGDDLCVKVEPAEYCCANTLYTAFVRQFRPDHLVQVDNGYAQTIEQLEQQGYAMIPRSGTFRDLARRLDHIVGTLGFRILQLLPIHPTPTTFARMGRFGSPFAVIDFMDVDPALAEFDRKTTPLDQFRELLDAVHQRGGRLFLDIPVNHTGWASKLQSHHPDWFERGPDRSFRSPGAWGVTWEDLSQLNYGARHLWQYVADIFLYWAAQGVDGFRCDAGYMVPYTVWEYVVAKVREQYPDTVFLLEGLGGKLEVTEKLLAHAGLDWAYSELFQQYDRSQVERYLPDAMRVSRDDGLLVHFAETHDNNRLAATSETYARMRTAFSALVSDAGGYGITAGVEWYAREKIDVHGAPPLNWDAEDNMIPHLRRLNAILAVHPAFGPGVPRYLVQTGPGNSIALMRSAPTDGDDLLVLANLSHDTAEPVAWHANVFSCGDGQALDLVSGEWVFVTFRNGLHGCDLSPGQVVCLAHDHRWMDAIAVQESMPVPEPVRVQLQQLRAKAQDILVGQNGLTDIRDLDIDARAQALAANPRAFCESACGGAPCVTTWQWPRDIHRKVMLPPGQFLLIEADVPFLATLRASRMALAHEHAVRSGDRRWFAVVAPVQSGRHQGEALLEISAYEAAGTVRTESPILLLAEAQSVRAGETLSREDVIERRASALCTNGRGAMAHVQGAWGEVRSQYDAFLAANLDPDVPVDRWVMFTRCRAWLVYRGYSQRIGLDCLTGFARHRDGSVTWTFNVPAGLGKIVPLSIGLRMRRDRNRIDLSFERHDSRGAQRLNRNSPVRIILRPDIEDRSCHTVTKAYLGAENAWPNAVRVDADGFVFAPDQGRRLHMQVLGGRYVNQPEWKYLVEHPFEAERGLDPHGDLFSPGYFSLSLEGGESRVLQAEVNPPDAEPDSADGAPAPSDPPEAPGDDTLLSCTRRALADFVVKRGNLKTVIAGYPWFLDWGRDTLICLRGLIAAGYLDEARDILRAFGALERQGTIPNMLLGADDTNRDTSDAPLWFLVACRDLARVSDRSALLAAACGDRTLRDVLFSIANGYLTGTPNGIRVDNDSGLVFSPSHFTWMDTNHPAGTPRQGYPVEIQALWFAGLDFLSELDRSGGQWADLRDRVGRSLLRYFYSPDRGYLSDCLHACHGAGPDSATADDALRPNQLLAITLGALPDKDAAAAVLRACEELLVPGAIRSLADRPVMHPLPVHHNGVQLNDPYRPYWGEYRGDEDTRRKPAYHNGTAWTWPFPSYAEAMVMVHGEVARNTALSLLGSSAELLNRDWIGHIPEIVDGNLPHAARGCGAQAWGATELYRVLAMLAG